MISFHSVGPTTHVSPGTQNRSLDADDDTPRFQPRNHYQEITDAFHRIRLALLRLGQDPTSDRRAIESFQREANALQQNLPEQGNHPAVMILAENLRALADKIMALLPENDPSAA